MTADDKNIYQLEPLSHTHQKHPVLRDLGHPLVKAEHLSRLAIIYERQSSGAQVERNIGSAFFQKDQREIARLYHWKDDQILHIDDDLGVSSRAAEQRRHGWQRMM